MFKISLYYGLFTKQQQKSYLFNTNINVFLSQLKCKFSVIYLKALKGILRLVMFTFCLFWLFLLKLCVKIIGQLQWADTKCTQIILSKNAVSKILVNYQPVGNRGDQCSKLPLRYIFYQFSLAGVSQAFQSHAQDTKFQNNHSLITQKLARHSIDTHDTYTHSDFELVSYTTRLCVESTLLCLSILLY